MNRTLICSALAVIGAVAAASLVSAADQPSGPIADRPPDTVALASLDLHTDSRAYTLEYLTRDSDGDGWTDWYERLDGTDPHDPSSHPGGVRVDVIDATVFVQSYSFPDRIIALDEIELPAMKDSFGDLTDVIISITGGTSLGKFRKDLVAHVNDIAGDRIGDILADVAKHHDKEDIALGGRTNGQLISTISWDLNASVGSEGASTTATVGRDATSTTVDKNGIGTSSTHDLTVNGSGATFTTVRQNGRLVMTIQTEYVNGVVIGVYPADAKGDPLPPLITPLSSVAPAATTPPVIQPVETKPAETTPAATVAPKPVEPTPATTVAGGYSNPDADSILFPTTAEIEARIAFLSGVKTRYLPTIDVRIELNKDKPGVHDPAEPECRDERCVVFTEVIHPDLDRAGGACPTTFCNAGPGLGGKS